MKCTLKHSVNSRGEGNTTKAKYLVSGECYHALLQAKFCCAKTGECNPQIKLTDSYSTTHSHMASLMYMPSIWARFPAVHSPTLSLPI